MILRFRFEATTTYFLDRIRSLAMQCGVKLMDSYRFPYLFIEFEESEEFLQRLDNSLFNSLFFKSVDVVDSSEGSKLSSLPSSVYLCPQCLQELLDPSSRRYYYPFINCNSCGYRSALLTSYPQKCSNTLLNFFKLCEACQEEQKHNPFRKDSPYISCIDCNVPLKLSNKSGSKLLYANSKDEYKRVFELLGAALQKGERVLVKTFRGWKRFGLQKCDFAMLTRPSEEFLLLAKEKRALFSIERPMMYLTRSSGEVVRGVGVWDAFTTLLAKESGADVIYFDEKQDDYTLRLDFDLPITFYEAPFLFLNRHFQCFKEGESLFPKFISSDKTALFEEFLLHQNIIDKLEHFDEVETKEIVVFQDEPIEHFNIKRLPKEEAIFLGVLKENEITKRSVGVYFGEEIKFFLYDKGVRQIFAFGKPGNVIERPVVKRFREQYPDRFAAFLDEEHFLLKAARLLGFAGDMEQFNLFSLQFGGKGGVSIDCGVGEEGFDYSAFYASIMSFVLAEAKPTLIAYSIFESLGEYLSNQAVEILRKSEAAHIALFGRYITNHPFFSRFVRNTREVKLPRQFPIDNEGVFASL